MNLLWVFVIIFAIDFVGSLVKVGIAWERGVIIEERKASYYVMSAILDVMFLAILFYVMKGC